MEVFFSGTLGLSENVLHTPVDLYRLAILHSLRRLF